MLSRFFSRVCVTPWTVTRQAPLSMGFPRQEYWSGLPGSPPGDLPGPRIKPASFRSPALAGGFFTASGNWEAPLRLCVCVLAKLILLCLTLCDLMDCSPPGSSVHGILQMTILEWVEAYILPKKMTEMREKKTPPNF